MCVHRCMCACIGACVCWNEIKIHYSLTVTIASYLLCSVCGIACIFNLMILYTRGLCIIECLFKPRYLYHINVECTPTLTPHVRLSRCPYSSIVYNIVELLLIFVCH